MVPLDASGGILGVNPAPAQVTSSINDGVWTIVLTSVSYTPAAPSITSSVTGTTIMSLELGPVSPAHMDVVEQTSPSFHYGLDLSTTPNTVNLALQVPQSIFLGLDFPATSQAAMIVNQPTGILRVNFEDTVQQSTVMPLVLQSPSLLHVGQEFTSIPGEIDIVQSQPAGFSAATGYVTVTASVEATSSINITSVELSSVVSKPSPINIVVLVSSLQDSLEVILSTVMVGGGIDSYSSVTLANVVLGSVKDTPKLPIVRSSIGMFGVNVTEQPPPIEVVPALPFVESSVESEGFEVVLGSITVDLHSGAPEATASVSYTSVAVLGSATITPAPAKVYSEVLIGSKYVPVSVSPQVNVTSTFVGEAILAPEVVSGLSTEITSSATVSNEFYGSVSVTPHATSIESWIFPPQILTTGLTADPGPAEATSSVTLDTIILGSIAVVNDHLQILSEALPGEVVLSTVSVEPVGVADAFSVVEAGEVIQPDEIVANVLVEVLSTVDPGVSPVLGSVTITPVAPLTLSSAQGQFKYGTATKAGQGGEVVTTDNRGQLNVDPLQKPGLNSITVQN